MAYAYKQVDDLIGGTSAGKQNIFAPTADPSVTGQPSMMAPATPSTFSTFGSSSGSGGGNPSPATSSLGGYNANASSKAAVAANANKTETPTAVGQVKSSLDQRTSDLQKASNDYVTKGTSAQTYGGGIDYGKAVSDAANENFTKLQGLMNRKDIDPVENFVAPDVKVSDVAMLGNREGISKLASRGQDQNYTRAMGNFDADVLQRDPRFSTLISSLQGQQQKLSDTAAKAGDLNKAAVETAGKQNLADAQLAAGKQLKGLQGDITTGNKLEMDQANARLSKIDKAALSQAAAKKILEDTKKNTGQEVYIGDPTKYVDVRNPYTADQFNSADDAKRWNNINLLLGLSGQTILPSAAETLPEYRIDYAGMSQEAKNRADLLNTIAAQQRDETQRQITAGTLGQLIPFGSGASMSAGYIDEPPATAYYANPKTKVDLAPLPDKQKLPPDFLMSRYF